MLSSTSTMPAPALAAPTYADATATSIAPAAPGPAVTDRSEIAVPAIEFLRVQLALKRALDVVGSAAALVVLLPVCLLIAIIIKIESSGPVLYCSDRLGRGSRRFRCYKFRSMVANADAVKAELRQRNERTGAFFKMKQDPRITTFGYFIRKYSLDELPQFWNVLIGDMSLVGPRPHPTDDCALYKAEHYRRLEVQPGLTGLWQVTARQDSSFEKSIALDLEYIDNWSLWLDLRILARTLPAVLGGTGW